MSGHTSWQETKERRLRAMTPQARAQSGARALREREKLGRSLWLLRVECRFLDAMQAAAAREPFDWGRPKPDGEPPFALVRLDDRIDLALTIDDDGRCTVPIAGRFTFGRVAALQEAADAERHERLMKTVRHRLMTLEQARQAYSQVEFDYAPLFSAQA